MKPGNRLLNLWPLLLLPFQASAAHMTSETLAAWDQEIQQARAELNRQSPIIEPVTIRVESARPTGEPVPSGLIHHWIGSEFIPKVGASELLAALQDYDAYAEIFAPAVTESHLLSHTGNVFTYRLKMIQKALGVKTGLLTSFESRYVRLDDRSGYSVTEAKQLTELQNPGKANERLVPASAARGFVEKIFTIMRYREEDGGVLVEVETWTLSRDVPGALRWLVTPFIERFSRQTMTSTLEKIKDSVPDQRSGSVAAR